MNASAYELLASIARYWFLGLAVLIAVRLILAVVREMRIEWRVQREISEAGTSINATLVLLSDEDRNRTWTDGVFRFRDEPLSMIVSRLEKYYGIGISVDDSLGSVRYTGAFPLEQKITEVLETLNFEKRFTVVQHGSDFALERK